ncbi:hypothetical protein LSH36_429g01017, partial [Paralvinella palmiformis]
TVKDLIRFLKREDESCDIRRQLGHSQILQRDLVPIIKQYNDKEDRLLLETILRLMVNLTQPAKLCFQNQIPEDKTTRNYYLEVESHLQVYKEAFIDEALFAILTKKLGELLQLDWENRQEEDRLLIERILILLRNILHVPPNVTREKDLRVCAAIFYQLYYDSILGAHAGVGRSLTEKEQDERELVMKRQQEQAERRAAILKQSTRHSRFGGTFTVKNMKSISDKEVIYHSSLGKVKDITFDHNKRVRKRPKNRQAITEKNLTRRSTLSIRLFLKEFCIQFLENCYNPLMAAIKVKGQIETLSIPTFHYIQTHLQNFHEMILTSKKDGIIWSRRMHLALKAYHELLQSLNVMDKSPDDTLHEGAKVMKCNIFYMMEYRDIFVVLLRKFDETRQSRSFLKDLVETTHLFLRMIENFTKGNRHLVVQRKKRKIKRKKQSRGTSMELVVGHFPSGVIGPFRKINSYVRGKPGISSSPETRLDPTDDWTDIHRQSDVGPDAIFRAICPILIRLLVGWHNAVPSDRAILIGVDKTGAAFRGSPPARSVTDCSIKFVSAILYAFLSPDRDFIGSASDFSRCRQGRRGAEDADEHPALTMTVHMMSTARSFAAFTECGYRCVFDGTKSTRSNHHSVIGLPDRMDVPLLFL